MAGPGRRGPAPRATEAKRLLGNPGKRALAAPLSYIAPMVHPVPPAATGDDLITALLDSPAAAWIAVPDRLGILELVRQAWDERARCLADIEAGGYGEGRYARPVVGRLDRIERNLTAWFSLLGLTPADRSRLGVAEVRAQSKIDALRGRRDARLARVRAG